MTDRFMGNYCSLAKRCSWFSLFLWLVVFTGNAFGDQGVVTITMPADILRQTINDALPIPIETQNKHVSGNIVIESIDKLQLKENLIYLQGVINGTDLSMNTDIGGQAIKVRIGQVRLPVTCEIGLSFNSDRKMLFITPHFPDQGKKGEVDPANVVQPLLKGLEGKSYPVMLDSGKSFHARVGKRNIPVSMETVDIKAVKDMLVVKLRPMVNRAN